MHHSRLEIEIKAEVLGQALGHSPTGPSPYAVLLAFVRTWLPMNYK